MVQIADPPGAILILLQSVYVVLGVTVTSFWPSASNPMADPPLSWKEKSSGVLVSPLSLTTVLVTCNVALFCRLVQVMVADSPDPTTIAVFPAAVRQPMLV